VSDRSEEAVEAIQFLPRRASAGGAIPGLARGLAAVHARHGVRDWREVVSPGERYARFGHLVSEALHADLEDGAGRLSGEARRRFLGDDGSVPPVGRRLSHPALSAVLAGIRQQGAGYLYAGPFASRLADAAQQAGQPFGQAALSGYAAQAGETLTVPFGNHQVHLPPPPATGGLLAGQTWGMLREASDAAPALDADSAHLLAEAWKRSLARTGRWLSEDPSVRPAARELLASDALAQPYRSIDPQAATPVGRLSPPPPKKSAGVPTAGAVAVDRFGNLASCTFTMNALFGGGADAIGTGVLLAQPAPVQAAGADMLPVLIANEFTGRGYLALSGAGGADGVLAAAELIRKLEAVTPDETQLARDLGLPRLYHPGKPDELQVEPTLPDAARQRLRTMGHTVVTRPGMGRLQAIYCPNGASASGAGCQVASDPRGAGLGVRAQ
jgi:gamma-glutamyltranspeptidase/glutathione hydrolase